MTKLISFLLLTITILSCSKEDDSCKFEIVTYQCVENNQIGFRPRFTEWEVVNVSYSTDCNINTYLKEYPGEWVQNSYNIKSRVWTRIVTNRK